MMDTRNEYRATSHIYVNWGELWLVQFRPWWWPFWIEIDLAASIDDAKKKAEKHARPMPPEVRIATFGRLP